METQKNNIQPNNTHKQQAAKLRKQRTQRLLQPNRNKQ